MTNLSNLSNQLNSPNSLNTIESLSDGIIDIINTIKNEKDLIKQEPYIMLLTDSMKLLLQGITIIEEVTSINLVKSIKRDLEREIVNIVLENINEKHCDSSTRNYIRNALFHKDTEAILYQLLSLEQTIYNGITFTFKYAKPFNIIKALFTMIHKYNGLDEIIIKGCLEYDHTKTLTLQETITCTTIKALINHHITTPSELYNIINSIIKVIELNSKKYRFKLFKSDEILISCDIIKCLITHILNI
jgi:hypothetical protein